MMVWRMLGKWLDELRSIGSNKKLLLMETNLQKLTLYVYIYLVNRCYKPTCKFIAWFVNSW